MPLTKVGQIIFFTFSSAAIEGSGIRDPRSKIHDPKWIKIMILWIQEKHPGSATLLRRIYFPV
jgi:hypothetical protein